MGYKLLVVRVNHKEDLVDSTPCKSCTFLMKRLGIKRVYYSNERGEIISSKVSTFESNHYSTGLELAIKNGHIKLSSNIPLSRQDKNLLRC